MSHDLFPTGGGMPNFAELMKQAQKMQEELARSQQQLAQKRVETSAGGGMVAVTFSGARELLELRIDPQVVDPKDTQMLQDLIVAAINQGLQRVKALEEDELRGATAGLQLPGNPFSL